MYFGVRVVFIVYTTIERDVAETLFPDHSQENIKDVVESTGCRYTMIISYKYVYSYWTPRAWKISMLSRQTWNIYDIYHLCTRTHWKTNIIMQGNRNEIWDYGLCDKKKSNQIIQTKSCFTLHSERNDSRGLLLHTC